MTERQWKRCADPNRMLDFLADRVGDRKLRLFSVACSRHVWHLLTDRRSRRAAEVAERYADGLATPKQLAAAYSAADQAQFAIWGSYRRQDPSPVKAADWLASLWPFGAASRETPYPPHRDDRVGVAPATQVALLRDVFGNPFRPATLDPRWRTPDVAALAGPAYEERALPAGTLDPARLAVLADALEDAGCADTDLLDHLRSAGPHVRGCWAVDLLTGRG
jgi:hypothetical protein